MSRGFFISLEGGEGVGKSTLVAGLKEAFKHRQKEVLFTREPGGTPLGDSVRELVLAHRHGAICAQSELLLMFASRAQLVCDVIEPALAAGRSVICDRFVDASFAYQGGGRQLPAKMIDQLQSWVVNQTMPDLTLLLDMPIDQGRQRVASRGESDRMEMESDDFFSRVRASYHQRAKDEPSRFHWIDARFPMEQVLAQAIAAIAERFPGWK